jgi:Domain of unknown function (DUF4260)
MTSAALTAPLTTPLTIATATDPVVAHDTVAIGVRGGPRTLLRIEGALALCAGVLAYAALGGTWGWFAALFLVPDLSLLGYLAGRRVGAFVYNVGHSAIGPAILAALGWLTGATLPLLVAAIWIAHVGFDRALGYGLKYGSAFGDTHLGRIGRAPRA